MALAQAAPAQTHKAKAPAHRAKTSYGAGHAHPIPPAPSPTHPAKALVANLHRLAEPAQTMQRPMPVSATLAANELMARKKLAGETVLPLAFGEAALPVHPMLRSALEAASGSNRYGPVAGLTMLREEAAGYWARRGLPTSAASVICGPGSKPLLFGLLLAIGADVAVPRPSWVSYAAQASMLGTSAHFVPAPPGEGGICDPQALARTARAARAAGRRIGAVVVTLPDNPTGTLATLDTIRALCQVARDHDLIIISDEIYRDLVHDAARPFASPAEFAPERTVVTTALSKSLALGGWRIGVARLPESGTGARLRDRLLGIGSEIWSAPAVPIQEAAALAFSEPPQLTQRISRSRCLHARVAGAVAARFSAAGVAVPPPQAAFYLYPDFAPWRDRLHDSHGINTAQGLARFLLQRHGMGVLPGSAFGEDPRVLRVRVATGLLYGETDEQREAALAAADPLTLPWIAASLARIEEVLAAAGELALVGT